MIINMNNKKKIQKNNNLKCFQYFFFLKKKILILPMIGFLIKLSDLYFKFEQFRNINNIYLFLKINIIKFDFMIFIFQYYDLFFKNIIPENRLKILNYNNLKLNSSVPKLNSSVLKLNSYLTFFEKRYHISFMHLRKLLNASPLPKKKPSSKILTKWRRINPAKGITRFRSTTFREWGWRVSLGVKTPEEVTALVFEEQDPRYQSEICEFDLDLPEFNTPY